MSLECRDCQTYRERNERFCRMCGRELNATAKPTGMIYYELREKFCGDCGERVHFGPCAQAAASVRP